MKTRTKWILGVLALLVVASFFREGSSGTAAKRAPTTPNAESIEERAQRIYEPMLRKALASDEQCDVTRMVYQGMDQKVDEFYWSAACRNGKSTLVRANGSTGKITYLDCGVAATIGVRCFEPLTAAPSSRLVR